MAENKDSKKQIVLRLSPRLWEELSRWAEDDFRSVNSQIEFLLSECVAKRKKTLRKLEKAQRGEIARDYIEEQCKSDGDFERFQKLLKHLEETGELKIE